MILDRWRKKIKDKYGFLILIVIAVFLCFIVVFASIKFSYVGEEMEYHIVYYDKSYYQYEIETTKNFIRVYKKEVVVCVQAPCNPIPVDEFKVRYTKENRSFIEDLFNGKDTREVYLRDEDLDANQMKILYSIIHEKITETSLSYQELESNQYSSNYSERGYYLESMDDGQLKVTISMGVKSTGGYRMVIQKINILNDDVQIYVSEDSPKRDEIVTDAFTTPNVQILFNKNPKSIVVMNYDDNQYYKQIN